MNSCEIGYCLAIDRIPISARRFLSRAKVFLLCLGLALLLNRVATCQQDATVDEIRIGQETTFFTGPLDEHGELDRLQALNDLIRGDIAAGDIAAENNAAIGLIRIFGQRVLPEHYLPAFRRLGLQDQDDPPKPFASLYRLGLTNEDLQQTFLVTLYSTWHREQFPAVAKWLDSQSAHLDAAVKVANKERLFIPVARGNDDGSLYGMIQPLRQEIQELGDGLCIRANLNIAQQNYADAYRDIRAIYRLAFLLLENDTYIESWLANSMIQDANRSCAKLLSSQVNMDDFYAQLQSDLENLPPVESLEKHTRTRFRLLCIDKALAIQAGQDVSHDGRSTHDLPRSLLNEMRAAKPNWNQVLRHINQRIEMFATIVEKPSFFESNAELEPIVRAGMRRLEQLNVDDESMRQTLKGLAEEQSSLEALVANIIIDSEIDWFRQKDPIYRTIQVRKDCMEIAIALERYHLKYDQYPESLDLLAPKFLTKLPSDPFYPQPYRYRIEESGFRVYSVGVGFRDEAGQALEHDGMPTTTDDVGVWINHE